jgi:hypothetical protein
MRYIRVIYPEDWGKQRKNSVSIIIVLASEVLQLESSCTLKFDLTWLDLFLAVLQEHIASTKHLQLILFWAKALLLFQVFPTFPVSSSLVLLHSLLCLPPLRRLWGFQLRACLSVACGPFLKACPIIHCHFLPSSCWFLFCHLPEMLGGYSFLLRVSICWPPLWSSSQSSWLQIRTFPVKMCGVGVLICQLWCSYILGDTVLFFVR